MTYRTGDSINDRVTILTKTLFRYPCLYRFLDSVQAKYPGMTIIVADDNPDDTFEVISKEKYPAVKQYKMPAEEGWFAGRALAISQVRTDYFVWCDDDFVFYEESDMEYMKFSYRGQNMLPVNMLPVNSSTGPINCPDNTKNTKHI